MKQKTVRIGFDFDGVIAYNPFRVVRAPWAYFKRHVLGVKKLTFFYPQNERQRIFWRILHESSLFPANGTDLLMELVRQQHVEAYLISGRFRFLKNNLYSWLTKYNMKHIFQDIITNEKDEQPHLFKEKIIQKIKPSIYIEDNLDIVEYLAGRTSTKVYWIYNVTDRFHTYPFKYPVLKHALRDVVKHVK